MDGQFFWALIRLLVFLPLVLCLAYLTTRYVASWRFRWQRGGPYLEVVEHVALGPRAGLYIIRLGGKHYLFTATGEGLNLVRELEDYPAVTPEASHTWLPLSWSQEVWCKTRKGGEGHAP